MQSRTFFRQVAGVGALSLIDRAVAVGFGIVFARWMGPAEFGAYSYAIAVVGLLMLPARLGLPELLTRDVAAGRGTGLADNSRQMLCKGFWLVGLAALATVLAAQAILHFLPDSPLVQPLRLGLWLVIPAALLDVAIGVLRGVGRTFAFQFYGTLLLSTLTLGIGTALMLTFADYSAMVALEARFLAIGLVLSVASVHLWMVVRHYATGDGGAVELRSVNLVRQGFGFMINALVYMALMRVDLLVLGIIADESAVGLYRVAVEGGLLVAFAYGSATVVLAPEYARLNAAGDVKALQHLVHYSGRMILLVGALISAPLILFPEPIIILIFGQAYADAALALSILAAGHLVTFLFGDPVFLLNMTGYHHRITKLVMICLMVSIALSVILIPPMGAAGAALAASLALILYRFLAYRAVADALNINCAVWAGGRNPDFTSSPRPDTDPK